MQNETHYYLIKGKVMKGGEMPEITNPNNDSLIYGDTYIRRWISSLKPCEIDQRELEKIKNKVYTFNNCHADNPIDITDIVKEIYCKCNCGESFIEFKQPKQVDVEIDVVELKYTTQEMIDAVNYGFSYAHESQNHTGDVPLGNILQWIMYKRNLLNVPKEFKDLKDRNK